MSEHDGPFMFHAGMDRQIRRGTWRDHERSTYDLCLEAINAGRWQDASALAAYTIEEALEPHELYRDWFAQIRDFILQRGASQADLDAEEEKVRDAIRWPDGSDFDPDAGWHEFCTAIDQVKAACAVHDAAAACEQIEAARQAWLETHDRKCDWVQGLIMIAAKLHGEECIGTLWDILMGPMFDSYDRYDVDVTPWAISAETLLQVTAEALRGHLTGPERRGTLTFVEEPDRLGFRFRPCGSGGRNFDGKVYLETPLTTRAHDWAWNMKGVCLYCAHCCAPSERNPIDRFGYPARVIEPPFRDGERSRDHCTWWIYKDPKDVPQEVYARTGNRKPERIGAAARRTKPRAAGG